MRKSFRNQALQTHQICDQHFAITPTQENFDKSV